jgi:predicted DCC family thiol-disulfide oxidoreductase YuxK
VVTSQSIDYRALGLTDNDVQVASWWVESIDGEIRRYSGAENFAALLINSGRFLKPLGFLMFVPPVSWLAKVVYSWIARNRGKMPGASEACEIPPSV